MDFNSFWYITLFSIGLILFLYVYAKKKNVTILLFLLAMIGLGYIIEAIIYNFLLCYQYYPHFIKNNPIYDSNMGAIASNSFVLPVVAVYLAVIKRSWKWTFFLTILIIGIEFLFLWLNIYQHNWWRTEFTFIGLLTVYFPAGKVIYRWFEYQLSGFKKFILLFFIIGTISGTLHILPIMFLSNRYYELGWYSNTSLDTNAFSAIYYFTMSLVLSLLALIRWRYELLKFLLVPSCVFVITIFLEKIGILHSLIWWDKYYYLVIPIFLMYIANKISNRFSLGTN